MSVLLVSWNIQAFLSLPLSPSVCSAIRYCPQNQLRLKQQRPWFDEEFPELFDSVKQARLKWLQNTGQIAGDNLNVARFETRFGQISLIFFVIFEVKDEIQTYRNTSFYAVEDL
jgi:hypothetical protein